MNNNSDDIGQKVRPVFVGLLLVISLISCLFCSKSLCSEPYSFRSWKYRFFSFGVRLSTDRISRV